MLIGGLLFLYALLASVDGKIYTKCGLAQDLVNMDVSRSFVGNWVCLVETESSRDTSKVVNKANGGQGLGLFQINSKDWCQFNSTGGKCNMICQNLLNDDIRDDFACAKQIFDTLGFQAWDGWIRSCKGRNSVTQMPKCPGL